MLIYKMLERAGAAAPAGCMSGATAGTLDRRDRLAMGGLRALRRSGAFTQEATGRAARRNEAKLQRRRGKVRNHGE